MEGYGSPEHLSRPISTGFFSPKLGFSQVSKLCTKRRWALKHDLKMIHHYAMFSIWFVIWCILQCNAEGFFLTTFAHGSSLFIPQNHMFCFKICSVLACKWCSWKHKLSMHIFHIFAQLKHPDIHTASYPCLSQWQRWREASKWLRHFRLWGLWRANPWNETWLGGGVRGENTKR